MPARPKGLNAAAFLAAFRSTGSITKAAEAAKIDRRMHYRWMDENPEYRVQFEQACQEVGDMLEAEAIRRANEGVLNAVFYQGKPVGAVRMYSDGLMQFLLRGFKPEKYARSALEIGGSGGGPVELTIKLID